jgi:hypothetical protein
VLGDHGALPLYCGIREEACVLPPVQVTTGHGDIEEQQSSVNLICTCRMTEPDQIDTVPPHVL